MDNPIYQRPNTYTMIPRVLAFIEKNDEVLMIERAKKDAFAYRKLNGIGGHVEKGEDPLTAIRREVKEESGLEIDDFFFHAVIFIDVEEEKGVCVFLFSATYDKGDVQPSPEGSLVWIKKDAVQDYPVVEDVPFLLDIIGESKKDGEVKYLQYRYVDEKLTIARIT